MIYLIISLINMDKNYTTVSGNAKGCMLYRKNLDTEWWEYDGERSHIM
jgi:hypothetical protein